VHITRLSEDKDFRLQHRSDDDVCTKWENCWVRCGNDAPWDLRRNLYAELSLVPRRLETRTKRGFPHSHSDYGDYGDGTRSGGKANPAKIAGRVGFLHRTELKRLDELYTNLTSRLHCGATEEEVAPLRDLHYCIEEYKTALGLNLASLSNCTRDPERITEVFTHSIHQFD
jgi:hypothetical protein